MQMKICYILREAQLVDTTDRSALQADCTPAAAPDQDGRAWVLAPPQAKDGQLQNVRIGFRAGPLASLAILDSCGQKSSMTFAAFQSNVPLDAASFQFKPPQGADVVRQ